MLTEPISRAEQIAKLNDRARSGFDPSARIMFTRGCLDAFCRGDTPSGLVTQAELIKTMRRHRFEEDAYGERDFGAFTFRGEKSSSRSTTMTSTWNTGPKIPPTRRSPRAWSRLCSHQNIDHRRSVMRRWCEPKPRAF